MNRILSSKQFRFISILLVLVAAGLWTSSCSKKKAPTEPTSIDTGMAAGPEEQQIQDIIDVLFPTKPQRLHQAATRRFRNIVRQWNHSEKEAARGQMIDLVDYTLYHFGEGHLLDPPGEETTGEAVSELIVLLFEYVEVEGAADVVPPGGGAVLTEEEAGADIPEGALDEPIVMTVRRIIEGEWDPPFPIDLPTFGGQYEFKIVPKVVLKEFATAGLYVHSGLSTEQDALIQLYRLDRGSGLVYALTIADWPVVDGGFGASMAKVLQLRGLGGLTKHFSDIITVLPAQMDLDAGNDQTAPVGTPVPIDPAVLVTDEDDNPVRGARVRFVVTYGGGSVDPSEVVTGTDGIASTTWTLGPDPGPNTLEARGIGIAGPGEDPFTDGLVGTGVVEFTATGVQLATISGTVVYNELPVTNYTNNDVSFWARDEGTGQGFPISPTYNSTDGTYSIPNVPPGTYGISVRIDDAEPFDGRDFPGDYNGWNSPIVVDVGVTDVYVDLDCEQTIHLTAPIDNLQEQNWWYDPFVYWQSPVTFDWEAISEATTYTYSIDRYLYTAEPPQYQHLGNVTSGTIEAPDTQVSIGLDPSEADEHYEFSLYAYNDNYVMIGKFMIVYVSGYGWDYRFRVQQGGGSPPPH